MLIQSIKSNQIKSINQSINQSIQSNLINRQQHKVLPNTELSLISFRSATVAEDIVSTSRATSADLLMLTAPIEAVSEKLRAGTVFSVLQTARIPTAVLCNAGLSSLLRVYCVLPMIKDLEKSPSLTKVYACTLKIALRFAKNNDVIVNVVFVRAEQKRAIEIVEVEPPKLSRKDSSSWSEAESDGAEATLESKELGSILHNVPVHKNIRTSNLLAHSLSDILQPNFIDPQAPLTQPDSLVVMPAFLPPKWEGSRKMSQSRTFLGNPNWTDKLQTLNISTMLVYAYLPPSARSNNAITKNIAATAAAAAAAAAAGGAGTSVGSNASGGEKRNHIHSLSFA